MRVARRKLDAAKRVNRTHSKYSFELTELCLSGLPEQVSSEALMVQCVRGPKLTATEEAEIDEEKLSRGEVLWPGQRLSFVATLYASKTGKEFSAKKYKVSLIGIRPAAFGTTKKLLKELSSAELNVSEFANATDPLPYSLTLPLRGGKTSLTLSLKVAARPVATVAGDEDDDDASISSALTGFTASQSEISGDVLEQDLSGFGEEAGRPGEKPVKAGRGNLSSGDRLKEIRELQGQREGLAASIKRRSMTPPPHSPALASPSSPSVPHLQPAKAAAAAASASASAAASAASASSAAASSPSSNSNSNPWSPAAPAVDSSNPFAAALGPPPANLPFFKRTVRPPSPSTVRQPSANPFSPRTTADEEGEGEGEGEEGGAEGEAVESEAAEGAVEVEQLKRQLAESRAEVRELRAQRAAAEAERDALQQAAATAALRPLPVGGGGGGGAVEELEAQLAAARGQLAAAESRGASEARGADEVRAELVEARARLTAAQAAGGGGGHGGEEMQMQLVEAKIDAAQYAFEREEAVQRLQAVTKKAEMSQGGGMKLAQQLTAMEVRYEDTLT